MNTKIDAADVQALVQKHPELTLTPQSAFIKIEHPNGLRIYATKSSWVTRIDISGFDYPSGPGVVDLPEEKWNGKVHQQVDFAQSKEVILETIEAVLEYMVKQPKKETKRATKEAGPEAKGWSFQATTEESQPQA